MSIGRQSEPLQAKVLTAELAWRQVRELRDPMDCSRIHHLVLPRSSEISLEHFETVVVLLLRGIVFPKTSLESSEVVLSVQQVILSVRHDLTNQRILDLIG